MSTETPFSRANVVKNTALILAFFVVLATVLRSMVAGQIDSLAAGLALACAGLLFIVYRQVKGGAPPELGGAAVLGLAFAIYGSLTWISDGLSGSIIFAAPMLPLLAGLLLGRRAARNVTILTGAFLLFVLSQHLSGAMTADPNFPEEVRYSVRVVLLLLMLVAINWMVTYYELLGQAAATPLALDEEVHDSLTGLLLRDEIENSVAREFDAARRAENNFSFALVEIDRYTELVEEYGMHGAENCLLGIADALRFCVRKAADDLGRFSETRLCILMSDNGGTGMNRVTEKFHKLVETLDIPVDPSHNIRVTVSVGMCTEPARGLHGPTDIMAAAETALLRAQAAGGNAREREQLERAT